MPPKKTAVSSDDPPAPSSSDAAPEEVVKKKSDSTVRKLLPHPSTAVMVREALQELDSRKGVSSKAIQNYIRVKYPSVDLVRLKYLVRRALRKGLENGTLVRPAKASATTGATGKFRLAPKVRESKPKSENVDPNAAPRSKAVKGPTKKKDATKEPKSKEEVKAPKKSKDEKAAPVKKPKTKTPAAKADDGADSAKAKAKPKKEAKGKKGGDVEKAGSSNPPPRGSKRRGKNAE